MTTGRPDAATSVSTHVLDTAAGRPAAGVPVRISARGGAGADRPPGGGWTELGSSATDADGRCRDLPAPPPGTTTIRLDFETGPYLARDTGNTADTANTANTADTGSAAASPAPASPDDPASPGTASPGPAPRDAASPAAGPAFFPEVTVTFAVEAGQHYHVPLLLSPFGYSVYRGS